MSPRMSERTRAFLTEDADTGDPWGWAMGHAFGIATVLYVRGEDVPDVWEFSPGPILSDATELEDWPDAQWAEMLDAGEVSADEMRYVGEVLRRYRRLCELAGCDY